MMTFQDERLCYDVMRQDICCDGAGHDDVPSTGHDDVLVLWADAFGLGTGHDDVRSYV